ncbi:MAG TPA: farnesyl diphosphate synthase [Lactovum miscens]|uniref:polyprenyl synthetase family protein n=1 Tax=Lactovum miscens TaxID=190387 RepID=UPI002ED7B90B
MIEYEKLEDSIVGFYKNEVTVKHLAESVEYSLKAGGKRIRPILFLAILEGFGLELKLAHYNIAAAIEWIHTGSLIHDDLPAMDNDDYRRGKLTNHKVYGEALAVLSGDALFLDPYYFIATSGFPSVMIVNLIRELSASSGSLGMVAGQVIDMDSEGKKVPLDFLKKLHQLKTGRMLTFPFVAAGIIAGKEVDKLRKIGVTLGLAFQIRDDILDVTADFESIGKTPGKDILEEKLTYVSLLGLEEARQELQKKLEEVKVGLSSLKSFNPTEVLKIVEQLEL